MKQNEKFIKTMMGEFTSEEYANVIEAISHKEFLTMNEASVFYGIGTSKIRKHLNYAPKCNFAVKSGKKWMIDREKMREYILAGNFAEEV